MSWDDDVMANVNDELFWDPKVDSAAIAVSADDGTVTLRGTVGSLREKHEARKAAQRVFGVNSVDNKLKVRLLGSVRSWAEHDEAIAAAWAAPGVMSVSDDLTIKY